MRAEKIVLSFIALLIGLAAAGVIFYFYQTTKSDSSSKEVAGNAITPTLVEEKTSGTLIIEKPQDGTVTDTSKITITGTTNSKDTVIIRTESDEIIGTPKDDGTFTMTVTLNKGVNPISVLSISPDGSEIEKLITITNTTEDF